MDSVMINAMLDNMGNSTHELRILETLNSEMNTEFVCVRPIKTSLDVEKYKLSRWTNMGILIETEMEIVGNVVTLTEYHHYDDSLDESSKVVVGDTHELLARVSNYIMSGQHRARIWG